MSKKKIVFLGSKPIGYQCLSFLIGQAAALNVEVTGVLTRSRKEFGEGNDLAALAEAHNIPVIPGLEALPDCDILYSVQYHQVLKQQHIGKATQAAINLHMAPLPEYRGANQFSFAILDRKTEFGTTIHKIDTRIDHGDILFQKRFPIPENCWVDDLYHMTFNASVQLFKETLADIVHERYSPQPQSQLEPTHGTSLHFRKEMDDIKVIDLSWNKDRIERHIRATAMPGFAPPYCIIDGKRIDLSPERK